MFFAVPACTKHCFSIPYAPETQLMKTTALFLVPALTLVLFAGALSAQPAANTVQTPYNQVDSLPLVAAPSAADSVFIKVKREASFFSGEQGWQSFLARTLKPNTPVKHKAPAGEYTVVVQFIVDTDGKLTDIKPLTAHGYGMEEEVVRVIKKSPRWTPAVLDKGVKVKAYRKQPVSFVVPAGK
jgi:hypothetical protein